MGRQPKHISRSLDQLFRDLGFETKVSQVRIVNKWPELVGPTIARISHAERVTDGILYIKVHSMSWRTELLFQKKNILERIENEMGKGVIKDIRFF